MHVTNEGENRLLAARLSSLGERSAYAFVKANHASDTMQCGCAAIGLVLMAPLFLVIGLLIKLTSQGPIFYRGRGSAKMDAFLPSISSLHVP